MQGFFKEYRQHFLYAGVFSFFDNMLTLVTPLYMLQLFDRVMTSQSNETLVMLTIAAVGGLLIMMVLETLRARLLGAASVMMDQNIGSKVVVNLVKSTAQLGGKDYAQGMRDVAVLRGFLTGTGIFAFFDSPWAIVFTIVIFIIHPIMGGVALTGAVLLFLLAYLNEKLTKSHLQEAMRASRRSSQFIDTSIRNSELVSAMGMLEGVQSRWFSLNDQVLNHQQNLNQYSSLINSATKCLRQLIQVAMLATGAYLVINQHLTPGIMMAATIILSKALSPVEQAITTWKGFVEAREAYANLTQLLASAKPLGESMPLPAPTGKLDVEKLTSIAPNSRQMVIKGISFGIQSGEVLGIIGPSAAGKSTLIRLLCGIWKPQSGSVRLDGVDVSEWAREEIGQYIGYLPQEAELFAGTIADNIARLTSAKDNSDKVIEAAKMAGVHELILRLPNGYETIVGGAGHVLSGGQRQRVALARVLYGKPKFVLLDEPNSNLDGEGEIAFVNSVLAMKQAGMTVVIVTHKPSILVHADKVLVLRDGLIEAFGPRSEIIGKAVRTTSVTPNNLSVVGSSEAG